MQSALSNWDTFFAVGGYALGIWLAVVVTLLPLAILALQSSIQRRALFNEFERQRAREQRMHALRAQREGP